MDFSTPRSRLRPAETIRGQAVRYLLVGGLAFVVDYALLVLFTELAGVNYLVSAVIGFAAGLAVSYFLCTTIVFARRSCPNRHFEFAIFSMIGVVGLGLTELILWLSEEVLHVDYRYAKVVAAAAVMAWNFSVRRAVLFRHPPPAAAADGR
jgi:putative flippase GtrA